MLETDQDPIQPRFSVVSAVYNVAVYLPQFIDAIDRQVDIDTDDIELIVVDDGSTDGSASILQEWADRNCRVRVLTQRNSGQAAARNAGMTLARGTWITFLDPDDTVNDRHFASVSDYIAKHPETEAVATNVWLRKQGTAKATNTHPLRFRFDREHGPRDLLLEPDFFMGSASAAFFRLDLIRSAALRFDESLRPNFEDGHFCIQYLLECDRPLVGFVKKAIYYYNKRDDGSSTLQNSLFDERRYTHVPRQGYLDALVRGEQRHGRAPEFIQNHIIYELTYYFGGENRSPGTTTAAQNDIGEQFRETVRELLDHIDLDVIESYRITRLAAVWRDALLHGITEENWHTAYCVAYQTRPKQRLIQLSLRYCGQRPEITYWRDGARIQPAASKVRAYWYFGTALIHEALAWLPIDGAIQVQVDGRPLPIRRNWAGPNHLRWLPNDLESFTKAGRTGSRSVVPRAGFREDAIGRLVASRRVRGTYGDSWALIHDGQHTSGSTLHLFEYLRRTKPDVNAWLVVDRSAAEWSRLRRNHGERIVAKGSRQWIYLMAHCELLIATQIELAGNLPSAIEPYRASAPRFIYLPSSVLVADLSGVLNRKKIDLMITSTTEEHESIVADHTKYGLTSLEVKRTGLPRFDHLREVSKSAPDAGRTRILVAPEWQGRAIAPSATAAGDSPVDANPPLPTWLQWLELVADTELQKTADGCGAHVALLLPAGDQPALGASSVPAGVELLSGNDLDVPELLATSRVLVTDTSPLAFDAAYVNVPVVYYQAGGAAQATLENAHTAGDFSYQHDGFGPLTFDVGLTVRAVSDALAMGFRPAEVYRARVTRAFPERDGHCCDRVTQAILALNAPERDDARA